MSMTALASPDAPAEPYFELESITYAEYAAINDALGDRRNPRMVYAKGRLVLMSPSRSHDWYAEVIGALIAQVATGCGHNWSPSGQATYRHPRLDAGVEGDRVFYVGQSALLMDGPIEIDLDTQPPPDLVLEVEHTHSADNALRAWGRIGAREVWRYCVRKQSTTFWQRQDNDSYSKIEASTILPPICPVDVDQQVRLAETLRSHSRRHTQLPAWVRDTLLPRRADPS
jgi:Uma2 family endonuclease